MATFLHTRRFLAYHGARFADVSVMLRDDERRVVGLFPAAVDPADARSVVSHPGITFGGLLHAGELYGEQMVEALAALRNHYADSGFEWLRYKVVPHIYHQVPAADDVYALFRSGATLYRCDLSCAIDLAHRREASSRRKRGQKKAVKLGLEIADGLPFLEQMWQVLEDNLGRKHGARPVHSAAEISYLHSLFPENIRFVAGLLGKQVVAGVVLFVTATVVHAQYIAASSAGYEASALDALLEHCIEQARALGVKYFDFGISNEDGGRYLNSGLYQFKVEFGGGGVAHEFYELAIEAAASSAPEKSVVS